MDIKWLNIELSRLNNCIDWIGWILWNWIQAFDGIYNLRRLLKTESSVLPTEEPDILPWHKALCATCAPTVLVGCSKTFNILSSKITWPGSVCLPQPPSLVLLFTAFALSLLRDTPPNPFLSTRTDALLCLRGRTERFTMPEDEPAFLICSLVQLGASSALLAGDRSCRE